MTKVECPVCGKTNLADNLAQCPQCNADLECFRLLEALYEHPPPGAGAPGDLSRNLEGIEASLHSLQDGLQRLRRAAKRGVATLILGVVIAIGMFSLYQDWAMQQWRQDHVPSSALQAEVARGQMQEKVWRETLAKAVAGIAQVSQQMAVLEQRMTAMAAQQPAASAEVSPAPKPDSAPRFWYHEPQENETLWGMARKYYQQGRLYPVLLEMNPGLGIYFDPDYGKIRILKDRQAAEEIFARVMFTKGERDFFRYQVQAEDTWQTISARFYGRVGDAAALQALNVDAQLRPGTRITVPLPK